MKRYGITGWKNAGKTTLTSRLVTEFKERGLRVSTVKHAHHSAMLDQPGTDTDKHAQAGAQQVMLATPVGWSLVTPGADPDLEALIAQMAPCDLILIEGFKTAPHPKIECFREGGQLPLVARSADNVRAIASDCGQQHPGCAQLDLNDVLAIADFISSDLNG